MNQEINQILNHFKTTSLDDIMGISYAKRTDTKFLIHSDDFRNVLSSLKSEYKVLKVDSKLIMDYHSIYFDTEELKFYFDHHNGLRNRIKLRSRKYVNTNTCFFEIKQQDSKGNTLKSRLPIDDLSASIPKEIRQFIKKKLESEFELEPSIRIEFKRITLVNYLKRERITFDFDLTYSKGSQNDKLENICIIELKQEKLDRKSVLFSTLRKMGIRPTGFSKYCMGIIHTRDNIKYNAFKPNLLKIKKLAG